MYWWLTSGMLIALFLSLIVGLVLGWMLSREPRAVSSDTNKRRDESAPLPLTSSADADNSLHTQTLLDRIAALREENSTLKLRWLPTAPTAGASTTPPAADRQLSPPHADQLPDLTEPVLNEPDTTVSALRREVDQLQKELDSKDKELKEIRELSMEANNDTQSVTSSTGDGNGSQQVLVDEHQVEFELRRQLAEQADALDRSRRDLHARDESKQTLQEQLRKRDLACERLIRERDELVRQLQAFENESSDSGQPTVQKDLTDLASAQPQSSANNDRKQAMYIATLEADLKSAIQTNQRDAQRISELGNKLSEALGKRQVVSRSNKQTIARLKSDQAKRDRRISTLEKSLSDMKRAIRMSRLREVEVANRLKLFQQSETTKLHPTVEIEPTIDTERAGDSNVGNGLTEARNPANVAEKELQASRADMNRMKYELANIRTKWQKELQTSQAIQSRLGVTTKDNERLMQTLKTAEQAMGAARTKDQNMTRRVEALNNQVIGLKRQIEADTQRIKQLDSHVENVTNERDVIRHEAYKLRKQFADEQPGGSFVSRQREEHNAQQQLLHDRIRRLEASNRAMLAERDQHASAYSQVRVALAQVQTERDGYARRLEQSRAGDDHEKALSPEPLAQTTPMHLKPTRPKFMAEPTGGRADNLQLIKGIGAASKDKLHALGIYHLQQIAGWSQNDVMWVDDALSLDGRITDEEWIAQARNLMRGGRQWSSQRPPSVVRPDASAWDDLKLIRGVGSSTEKVLNDLGIYYFAQIAEWTIANTEWVNDHLSFSGRIEREGWVAQASELCQSNQMTDREIEREHAR